MSEPWQYIESLIGGTPLVALRRLGQGRNNQLLLKLEMQNASASVKARAAYNMIAAAEQEGLLQPGTALVEATSGNTGIALAMVAAIKGYKMQLIMPENSSQERKDVMRAYGAELIEVSAAAGIEGARDLAVEIAETTGAVLLNQFANPNNPAMHYKTTAPEIWQQTGGKLTHFVSSMGTTGTITGCSRYFKEQNSEVQIIGLQPEDGANIPGIRKWPPEYLPTIFNDEFIDEIREVGETAAVQAAKSLAAQEGILCGISSGSALKVGLDLCQEVENAVIVCIACDSGERYVSTGVFSS